MRAGDPGSHYLCTESLKVVVCVMPPPLAVIVIVEVPVRAVFETVKLKFVVPEPGAAIGLVLKLPVTPEGKPVAERVIAELNPPETAVVTTTCPLWPWTIESEVGDTETVKAGVGAARSRSAKRTLFPLLRRPCPLW